MNITNKNGQKVLNVLAKSDYIKSITKNNNPLNGLIELIWNAIDADSDNIKIEYEQNDLGGISKINIIDDGHGLSYEDAEVAFSSLGGSYKKTQLKSPKGRPYHGKEGKGRYKGFLLGGQIRYKSVYIDKVDNKKKRFEISIIDGNLSECILSKEPLLCENQSIQTGVTVEIRNVTVPFTIFDVERIRDIETLFAVYYMERKDFSISVKNEKYEQILDFENQIQETRETTLKDENINYTIKLIHWKKFGNNKIHYCNSASISCGVTDLAVRTQIPLSVYIISDYIDKIVNSDGVITEFSEHIPEMKSEAQNFARKYLREIKSKEAEKLITNLKEYKLYPYENEPSDEVEKVERQMFDIIALELDEHLDIINKREERNRNSKKDKSTRFILELIKNSLGKDHNNLSRLLEEVVKLPKGKREELTELLEKTSLSSIIDTAKTVTERLNIIQGLRAIIFEKDLKKVIKERKHLQQIVQRETWIFGNDYADGVYDVNLENVLKAYIKCLNRTGFIEDIVLDEAEEHLRDIPDVCLFNQYGLGKSGYFKNLVIELKRPSKTITEKELSQIKRYAREVSEDSRFPKEKTEWAFILLVNDLDGQARFDCKSGDRDFGHIHVSPDKRVNVYVKEWGDLLNEAESKLNYLKDKLNYRILSNKEALEQLNRKHSEYLPQNILELS